MANSDVNRLIKGFYEEYSVTNTPIRINFRQIVNGLNVTDRYTHLIHSYPAKLLYHIPYFFLSTDYFCPKDGFVLDPFCGTGTVLLESILSGRNSYGADSNPLAVLISTVKTKYINPDLLRKTLHVVLCRARRISVDISGDVSSMESWFSRSTIQQLSSLRESLNSIDNPIHRDFFDLCFSNLIKKVSFADPSISVPVHLNPERFNSNSERKSAAIFRLQTLQCVDVYERFESICNINIQRISTLSIIDPDIISRVISKDARRLTASLDTDTLLPDNSIDFIMTSPPYAGAQKYIRSSRLNLYWLGTKNPEEIRALNSQNIGREDYHKKDYSKCVHTGISEADKVIEALFDEGHKERSYIVGNYLQEMKLALIESVRVLKPGGYMAIVIGNNTVCGRPFDTQDYLASFLKSLGLQLQFKLIDDIKSYGLMTKRNKTASMISCEWILVFQK